MAQDVPPVAASSNAVKCGWRGVQRRSEHEAERRGRTGIRLRRSVNTYDALRVQCHKLPGGLCAFSHIECYKLTDVSGDVKVVNPAVTRCLLHVYHTETRPNFSKRPGSERAAQRGTSHTHTHTHTARTHARARTHTHTHNTLRQSFRHFRRPRTREVHGILQSVSYVSAATLMWTLTCCCNHSALFDAKYCWFLLASINLFKIHDKLEILSDESLNALGELSSGPKTSCKIIIMYILTKQE